MSFEIPLPGEGYTFAGTRYTVHELHLTADSVRLSLGPPLRVKKGDQLELGLGDNGRVLGRFRPTGIRPKFYEKLRTAGKELPSQVFQTMVEVA